MLNFPTPTVYTPSKCYATYGTMGHLDPKQMPSKKKGRPWNAVQSLGFIHKIDLVFPSELLETMQSALADVLAPTYYRVHMSLEQILEREFFNVYIKNGSVLMLSEGKTDVNNAISLCNGQLTLYLDRETYERAGLVGKPYGVKGKRGLKPRWIVELDLTQSSMVHGKKGFDRLVYAAQNVFNQPITWLFCNASSAPDPDPMTKHFPTKFTPKPALMDGVEVAIPTLNPSAEDIASQSNFEDFASDIYEWLSLVRLQSPRIEKGDDIDPYLSRYRVPSEAEPPLSSSVCMIRWQGFTSPAFAQQVLVKAFLSASKSWFAFVACSLAKSMVGDTSETTVLRPPGAPGEYVLWEVKGPEIE